MGKAGVSFLDSPQGSNGPLSEAQGRLLQQTK